MPSINVSLTDEEFDELKKFKRKGEDWKHFLMSSLWLKGCVLRTPFTEFGEQWKIDPPVAVKKPCHKTGFCPYGQLVEAFPIKVERDEISCTVFGHDCPVFRCGEPLAEG